MIDDIKQYVLESLRLSFLAWGQSEKLTTFLALLSAGFITVIFSLLGWSIEFRSNLQATIVIGTTWFAILTLVVTPFRMWRQVIHQVRNYEAGLTPRFRLGLRQKDDKTIELMVQNMSESKITNVDVQLRNYRNPDNSGIVDLVCDLISLEGRTTSIDMNPHKVLYFPFATVKNKDAGKTISLLPTSNYDNNLERWVGPDVVVKLDVGATDSPHSHIFYRIQISEDGNARFSEWQRPVKA